MDGWMDAWLDGSKPPVPGFPSSRRVPYLCLKTEAFVVVSACFLSRSLKCGTVATLGFVLGSCPLWHSEGHYDTRDYTQATSKVCALCRAISPDPHSPIAYTVGCHLWQTTICALDLLSLVFFWTPQISAVLENLSLSLTCFSLICFCLIWNSLLHCESFPLLAFLLSFLLPS